MIRVETKIVAPPERCFLLSLSVDLHMASAAQTGERVVAGVAQGVMGPGETVTWRGRHFGLMLTHESRITRYERPRYFQDVMVKGVFRSFVHDHFFEADADGGTRMRDELRFAAPLGPLGLLAETLVLRSYLRRFLLERNKAIQMAAEGPDAGWLRFIGSG